MITNVTTVLVGKGLGVASSLPTAQNTNTPHANAGKFVVEKKSGNPSDKAFRIGLITAKNTTVVNATTGAVTYQPIIKWSDFIQEGSIKSISADTYAANKSSEDTAVITFNNANGADVKRILLRVTYKDIPARFRKWTETYEYIASPNESAANIAAGFAAVLGKSNKRNRFSVSIANNVLTLTAMTYDDDNTVDSISPANKVRFDVHMYYTMPNADSWAASNKYAYDDASIVKTDGKQYKAEAKLVRDREAWAMGYEGILNRGEGTWPIIKPEMNVSLSNNYDCLTIEFANRYRAADDIVRFTRGCVEIYGVHPASGTSEMSTLLSTLAELGITSTASADGVYQMDQDFNEQGLA